MAIPEKQRRLTQQCLIYCHVCFFVAYVFSLFTLSPQLHAAILVHRAHPFHRATAHCAPLATASALGHPIPTDELRVEAY